MVLAAVLGVRLSTKLGVPGLLLFLLLGLALGQAFPNLHLQDPKLATVLGYAALVVILAEGGLTTDIREVRPVLVPAAVLATIGVMLSIAAVAGALIVFGVEPRVAALLGAVLAATDAAAVFSVLRRMRLDSKLRALLEAEAGFNDAPVVVLVVVLSTTGAAQLSGWQIPFVVIFELIGGLADRTVLVGLVGRWVVPRLALPASGLYPIAVMALLIAAYGLADVVHTSGFLATYVAGVLVGNAEGLPHRRSVVGFAEGLAWSAQIGLFVMLGLLADPGRAWSSLGIAVVAGVALVVVGRPLAALTLAPFRKPWPWLAFVSVAGLRGAVPIVFAAIPLGAGVAGATTVFDATLILVVVLTLVQAPVLPWAAKRLGVGSEISPNELEVESAPLDSMDASLLGLEIPEGSKLAGLYIADLGLPRGAVVSLVVRDGEGMVPDLHTRLQAGDQLLVVSTEKVKKAATRRLRAVSESGRLAKWLTDREAPREGGAPGGEPGPGKGGWGRRLRRGR